jgi:hypothetical protein
MGIDILRMRSLMLNASCLVAAKKLETSLDMRVARIKIGSTRVGVEGIGNLIVAGFILGRLLALASNKDHKNNAYQSSKIIPDLRDVRVEANGT